MRRLDLGYAWVANIVILTQSGDYVSVTESDSVSSKIDELNRECLVLQRLGLQKG